MKLFKGNKGHKPCPGRSLHVLCVLAAVLNLSGCLCSFNADKDNQKPRLAGPGIVEVSVRSGLSEADTATQWFSPSRDSLWSLITLFEDLSGKPEVAGLLLDIGEPISWTAAHDLSHSLNLFRKTGRKVLCHLGYGSNASYLLAAGGCDRVVISPAGQLDISGVAAEVLYMKNMLSLIGIRAQMFHVGKYKGAAEPLTRDSMSAEMRQNMEQLLDARYSWLVDRISKSRKLEPDRVRELIDSSPVSAEKALEHGLVDQVATPAEVRASLDEHYQGGVFPESDFHKTPDYDLAWLLDLLKKGPDKDSGPDRPHIALVYACGTILPPGEEFEFFPPSSMVEPGKLASVLREMALNENVKAVVLRIDSPGGSSLASDDLFESIRLLARKKPVVASLGETAASGGYYIASAATHIISSPLTMTGSIGVVGGKIVVKELYDKINAKAEIIRRGKRAGWYSSSREFTEDETMAMQSLLKQAYDQFVSRVASGRGMKVEDVEKGAQGRVLTGTEALELKLVDSLGTISDAIDTAKELGSLAADAPVQIYPGAKGLFDLLDMSFGHGRGAVSLPYPPPAAYLADVRLIRALLLKRLFTRENILAISINPLALGSL